ncbi:LysR family transcriptional regulator [Anaerobacillus sp. MEB173]|uniref:LysR family transcriptional regulator n=1 Tax=Anaerobacillus sp. MEB173 TaxID=3383345 RepID=UPI003F928FC6
MDDKDWIILKTLYEEKNITKTANQLFLSQPSLTYRLKQIEKELGITIINRGRRGVEFTEQGEYLVKYANDMLVKLSNLKESLWNIASEVRGTLRLGVARAVAIYKLPRILKEFNTLHPGVEFIVNTGLNLDLINSVYKQETHIGIVRGNHHWSDQKIILDEEKVCAISNNKINIELLPEIPRIDYNTDPALIMLIDNWWKENFSKPPKVMMMVDNMEIAKRMAANGLGYTIVPDIVLEANDNFFSYNLKDPNGQDLKWITWVLFRKEYLNLSTVKEFVKFIKSNY